MEKNNKKIILFLVSQAITLFGSSIVQFGINWYVALQTKSGLWVGIISVCSLLPQFLISFISGSWCDRYSKKKLIIIADSIIALSTLTLVLLLFKFNSSSSILVLLACISVVRSLGTGVQTPAVNALIPEIVDEDKYMKFNGINSIVQSIVQFASPLVAGIVLSVCTLQITLVIDIVTAIIGITIFSFIALKHVQVIEKRPSMISEIKNGISYSYKNRFVGKVLIVFGLFIFLCVPAGFMTSLFVSRYYGDTYWFLTAIEISGFFGMVLGGILVSVVKFFKKATRTLYIGVLCFGGLAVLMGIINNFYIYLGLMFIYGIAISMVQTASTTLLQENTDLNMQGKVFGLFSAIYSGFLLLGMLGFGLISDHISLRYLISFTGIILLIIGIITSKLKENKIVETVLEK